MHAMDTHNAQQPMDKLSGLVERVTFHNEMNGYCVLRLKVKGERELVTLLGHAPSVTPGEYASALGNWILKTVRAARLQQRRRRLGHLQDHHLLLA